MGFSNSEMEDAGTPVFEDFEDTDLFGQVIDSGRCLQVGLINQTVANEIQTKYTEASEKRGKHLLKQLDEGILESEAGLLLSGDPSITIPDGIEKFLISPPELVELQRWVQQTNEAMRHSLNFLNNFFLHTQRNGLKLLYVLL